MISTKSLALVLSLTLVLGGLWALQSTTWGYLWVNDWVEWLLAFIVISIVVGLHFWFLKISVFNFFFLIAFFINLLLFIRFSLLTTRHSFFASIQIFYILIFCYIILFEVITKHISKLKQWLWTPLSYNTVALGLFCWFIGFSFVLKLFLVFLSCLFFWKKVTGTIANFYFHLIFITLYFIWATFFPFFFTYCTTQNLFSVFVGTYFLNIYNKLYYYYLLDNYFFNLDQIICGIKFNTLIISQLKQLIALVTNFNNFFIVILFLILIIFCKNG